MTLVALSFFVDETMSERNDLSEYIFHTKQYYCDMNLHTFDNMQ